MRPTHHRVGIANDYAGQEISEYVLDSTEGGAVSILSQTEESTHEFRKSSDLTPQQSRLPCYFDSRSWSSAQECILLNNYPAQCSLDLENIEMQL